VELNPSINFGLQNFDSLEFVELILYVERDFKISILEEEMHKIKTIDQLIEVIELKLA